MRQIKWWHVVGMVAPYLSWTGYRTSRELEQSHWNAFFGTTVLWGWLVSVIIAVPGLLGLFVRRADRRLASG